MAELAPFFTGIDCNIVIVVDNSQVSAQVIKWSVKPNGTKAADGVNGETRDRLAYYVNYFDLNFNILQVDTRALEAALKCISNDDSGALPLEKGVGFIITPPSGRKKVFQASGNVTVDDWEWASTGRTDRAPFTLPMRSQRFKEVRTF